ncbi:MAG: proline--tRNA ligase [Methanobacteriota archaeon]|nr:MAG: proline--tRNA ligase [Euryarchaeota archaeon]
MGVSREKVFNDFSAWYNDVIEQAGIIDKRYPVKGMLVWRPYGLRIVRAIEKIIREEVEKTGHQEVLFPVLIPEDEFNKEAEHIEGFGNQVYWVTHTGETPLEKRLLLRPTSETAIYPVYALWIRSHKDLPLKLYQIVPVFRYETKHTRPIIRQRELSHFFEAHTAHASPEQAEAQILEDVEIMGVLCEKLCIPFLCHRRPDWDKFAGAVYSIGVDTILPDGRVLQIGGIHNYLQNFAKPYNITYETEDGGHEYVYQTTYGMSERLLASLIALHGDDHGLVLPPQIAPVQVVVIPILYKDQNQEKILEQVETCKKKLLSGGLRVEVDTREDRPGSKFYDSELRGIPIRLEIGPRDVKLGQVVVVRRDTLERVATPVNNLLDGVRKTMDDMTRDMREKAWRTVRDRVRKVGGLDEAVRELETGGGIVQVEWCGSETCGHRLEDETGASVLGLPYPEQPTPLNSCVVCRSKSKHVVSLAKTY